MASKARSPETPPESGECHLFKLPPELRIVIYNMVFGELCFDGEEGWDDAHEKRLEALDHVMKNEDSEEGSDTNAEDHGTEGDDDDADNEDKSSDEESNVESESDGAHEEAVEVNSPQASAVDESEDLKDGNEMPEIDDEGQDGEADDGTSSDNLGAGSDGAQEDSQLDPNLHLTRPPLLDTCRLIRKEAIPVYMNALFLLAIRLLKIANKPMAKSKEKLVAIANTGFFARIMGFWIKRKIVDLMDLTTERVGFVLVQVDSVGNSVEGSYALSAGVRARFLEASKEFSDLGEDIDNLEPQSSAS